MILSDNETKIDLLNNEAIASTIIELIKERPDHPLTIGVHGDWGAGKSSILEMLESNLGKETKILCLKFNGWRFQGFEDAKIALIEGIVIGLLEKRPMLIKAEDTVKEIFQKIDWLKVAKKAGGLAFTAVTGIPSPEIAQSVLTNLRTFISSIGKNITAEDTESIIDEVGKSFKSAYGNKNIPKEIADFQKAFKELLDNAEIEQLVVLIDDLDRCLPETAIETLEAIRLFLFTERTAFVIAADEAMIEYAVRKHFPDLPESTSSQSYARKYLEKLIQIPFRIPALGEAETRIYIALTLVGSEIGEDDPAFIKLVSAAREKLKRPWTNEILNSATISRCLEDKASQAQTTMFLSDQIGPILAAGTNGNPRQIKRFLNTLLLRDRTAKARGFGNEVELPILAKLMLAERFIPRLFDQIATTAALNKEGKCLDLAVLENPKLNKTKIDKESKTTKSENKNNETALLDEWKKSPAICDWAKVNPNIGDIDLRPYLFITKDRKDYLGQISVLGHLAAVAEKLLGPKLSVVAMESDLKSLASSEILQIFDILRNRIITSNRFDQQPNGVEGLIILVKTHPFLQENLLDFLEMLPMDKLGAWACKGWGEVLVDPKTMETFDNLLVKWSGSSKGMLKTVAKQVLATRKKEFRNGHI